jgi:Transposase DDE domain group 1
MVLLVRHLGLAATIDEHLHLLKRHLPYHESDHVLNMTYNILAGGLCLEDLELRRQDVGYLEALGAYRIPDPTTAGDFLRRFTTVDVEKLMDALNKVRRDVWIAQPKHRRKLALIDVDGTIQETTGECKEGADFAYDGRWGYAPLVISLANSQEVLYTVNRPANQPSHTDAVKWLDKAVAWARSSDFEKVRLRGDTDFSLTTNFDRWTREGVEFVFGIDANPSFVNRAKTLSEAEWMPLKRRVAPPLATAPRMRPINVKEEKVREREFTNYRLVDEKIAEIVYSPRKSEGAYRMIILKKLINVEKGQQRLEDEIRYFFYVTNVSSDLLKAEAVVFESNARCHQENLIEQLKNGVRATQMPVGDLVSNWAYMVIGTLAWNLKIWLGLRLPEEHGAHALLKMEYRRFLNTIIKIPAQILRTGRRLVYRLLSLGGHWSRFILEASDWLRQRPKTV